MNGIGAGDEAAGIEAAELMQLSPWHLDRGEDIMRYHPSRRDDMFRFAEFLCRLGSEGRYYSRFVRTQETIEQMLKDEVDPARIYKVVSDF